MEFHEKLQQLRKKNNLTQEQLAERLFVSRTAVSKWESGRGYPNLESLKYISRLFSISIDDLLSNEELIELAETESQENISKVSILVFGALDIISIAFLFLPLFGQQDGEFIYAVPLLSHTSISGFLRTIYFVFLTFISKLSPGYSITKMDYGFISPVPLPYMLLLFCCSYFRASPTLQ